MNDKTFNIFNQDLGRNVMFGVCYAAATQICDEDHPHLFAIPQDGR